MAQRQIQMIEASLLRVSARLPDMPVDTILLMRLVQFLAHDLATMLEQHLRPFGLGEGEFRVLMALFSQPDGVAHPSDLCSKASQSPANMSRISDSLFSRELITRVPSAQDRRRMVLSITAKGEELVRSLLPTMFAQLREIFIGFSAEEQKQLIAQLKRLSASLDAVMAPVIAEPEI
jgi:MarR family transcriptional repressor of emrRAB